MMNTSDGPSDKYVDQYIKSLKRSYKYQKLEKGKRKMQSKRKQFDKALYDVADKAAKDAMVSWL